MSIDKQELSTTAALFADRLQKKRDLMAQLDKHNEAHPSKPIKYNADDILHIEDINGKIVFLERGGEKAGYKHVLTHADEFKLHHISMAKVPAALFSALRKNNKVGKQGKRDGRPIFEVDNKLFAISVGSNGYVVGANPTSPSVLKK